MEEGGKKTETEGEKKKEKEGEEQRGFPCIWRRQKPFSRRPLQSGPFCAKIESIRHRFCLYKAPFPYRRRPGGFLC